MSFMHMVFDGSAAGTVLQALSECCQGSIQMPVTQAMSRSAVDLRNQVSTWVSKCQTRLDHPLELGPPAFDSNFSVEQWGAVESTLASASATHRVTFSPEKVAYLKTLCTKLLPQLHRQPFDPSSLLLSSNDIITVALGISINRILHPNQTDKGSPTHIFMVADLRRRITPPLPDTYLGNMIYPVCTPIHNGQQARNSDTRDKDNDTDLLHLTQLASQLCTKVTATINETLAYSCSAAVTDGEDWFKMEGKPADIVMTSWRHRKVFALEFRPGLGYIEDFESGFLIIPGACIMLPQRTRELQQPAVALVPWEVSVTLRRGDYEALVGDPLPSRILVDS
ncbi:hypothetical protein BDW59DRAFT_51509 [Aspergillus cavernicola]|uniref:Transferase family-domain-containing protein n=1 Tax=Aspergillus cavernicola TaxID=176166 RepID=A0ABR4IKA0_9EURO